MKKRPLFNLILIPVLMALFIFAPVSADLSTSSSLFSEPTVASPLPSINSSSSLEPQAADLVESQLADNPAEGDDVSFSTDPLQPELESNHHASTPGQVDPLSSSLSAPPLEKDGMTDNPSQSQSSRPIPQGSKGPAIRAIVSPLFEGTVSDTTDSSGLSGAKVVAALQPTGAIYTSMAGVGGYYNITAPSGAYTVSAIAYGYAPDSTVITASTLVQLDFPLTPASFHTVSGAVTDAVTGDPVYVQITAAGDLIDPPAPDNSTTSSGLDGAYSLSLAEHIVYTLTVQAAGYDTITRIVGPLSGNVAANFVLTPDFAACTAPGYGFVDIFYDGFESGSLGADWSIYTTNRGRVQVGASYPYAGSYSLLLDTSQKNQWSMAAADITWDLTPYDNVFLDFWWREFKGKNHALDGVFISDDGVNWYRAFSFNNGPRSFRNDIVDVAAAAAANGLTLDADFGIRFFFFGNRPIDKDGYGIDEVLLKSCQPLSGAILAPETTRDGCCRCTSETHELIFVNHTGLDDAINIAYTASSSVTVTSIPTTLGVVPDNTVFPFDVVAEIQDGAPFGAAYYVTVTASLNSDPLISDTSIIEKQVQVIPDWERRQDTPLTIMDQAFIATDAYLYQIGGTDDVLSGRTDTLRYDSATNTWNSMASMVTGTYLIDGDNRNEHIYILGGFTGAVVVDTVQIYSESANVWSLGAAAPRSRAAYAAVELGGYLYRIGGGDPAAWGSTAEVDLYNPTADAWNNPNDPADYLWQVRWPCAGDIDGKLYVAGGVDNATAELSNAAVYDPATDTWSDAAMADAPTTFWGAADFVMDGQLVCAGGIQGNSASVVVWVYHPVTNSWGRQADLNDARFRFEGDFLSDGYALGGHSPVWTEYAALERAGSCPACLVPPDPVTDLGVSAGSPDVVLTWTHSDASVTHYQVWRSTNAPYFTPDDPGSIYLGDASPSGGTTSFTDPGAIGDTSTNYYYIVLAVNGMVSPISNRVGKFVLTILPGYNFVSNPLVPSNANINDLIGNQLTGGPNVTLGDRIYKWNASTQSYDQYAILIDGTGLSQYDGRWLDELSLPNESSMPLDAGQAFWIENRHAIQYVTLLGGVPTSSDQEFTFEGGNYTSFGAAYLGSFGLADSNLYESGASGGPNVTLGDRIFKWNASTQSYDAYAILIDNTGLPQYDGKWLDELNLPNESTMMIEPGQGYWFEGRSPGGFTWNYAR